MYWINISGTLLRIWFLAFMIVINTIGFHYYFSPVADTGLLNVPADSKLVLTINLKSVSLKLIHELLFNPDDFEKNTITENEKDLLTENAESGINPFGYISYFVFPVDGKMTSGITFHLDDPIKFKKRVEAKSSDFYKADEVDIAETDNTTIFVFENSAVVLFGKFKKSRAEHLALFDLQNENSFTPQEQSDVHIVLRKGILKESFFSDYFNFIPDFTEQIELNGVFLDDRIAWNGNIKCKSGKSWPEKFVFSHHEPEKPDRWQMHFSGPDLKVIIHEYLSGLITDKNDSTGIMHSILSQNYNSIGYFIFNIRTSDNLISSGINLLEGKALPLKYGVRFYFGKDGIAENSLGYGKDYFLLNPYLVPAKQRESEVEFEEQSTGDLSVNTGYFNFDISQLLSTAKIPFFIKNIIDSYSIFGGFMFWAVKYQNKRFYFEGKTTFKEEGIHSLVQLRLLFKKLSSLI